MIGNRLSVYRLPRCRDRMCRESLVIPNVVGLRKNERHIGYRQLRNASLDHMCGIVDRDRIVQLGGHFIQGLGPFLTAPQRWFSMAKPCCRERGRQTMKNITKASRSSSRSMNDTYLGWMNGILPSSGRRADRSRATRSDRRSTRVERQKHVIGLVADGMWRRQTQGDRNAGQ